LVLCWGRGACARCCSTCWSAPASPDWHLDDLAWTRARAWAIAVVVSGISYYWNTFPAFVAECRARLDQILTEAG
jgi:hypothetical protein